MDSQQEPLITKYRPKSLSEVVGHGKAVARLQRYVEDYKKGASKLPHLFLAGAPGIGKTTIAQALCRDLFGSSWRRNTLNLNASDERGIAVIRGKVKDFAASLPHEAAFSVIILDECDNLTEDAQSALRATIEENSAICRFILCCNYANKVIDPLIDRCAAFYFKPLTEGEVFNVVTKVMHEEQMGAPRDAVDAVVRKSKGSMRKALAILSQLQTAFTLDDVEDIYPGVDYPNLKSALAMAFMQDVKSAEEKLMQEFWKGTPPGEIFQVLFDLIEDSPLKRKAKFMVLKQLGEIEYRILFGCSPQVQMRSLIRSLALLKDGELE